MAPIISREERRRRYLFWGFVLSVLLHVIAGPFLTHMRFTEVAEKPEVEKVSVSKRVIISTPKPTPRPTPTVRPTPTPPPPTPPPTPPPKATPPPHKNIPPPQPKLRVNVPKTTSKSQHVPSESPYTPMPGNEKGVPTGHGTAAPSESLATAGPTLPATPTCAQPHSNAVTKNAVQPDYPEIAREQGAQGVAKVKVTLDAQGVVVGVAILQSTGNAALDQEALKAAKESTYSPEVIDCRPVGGDYVFTADFQSQ